MLKRILLLAIALPGVALAQVGPSPSLGTAEGRCRPGERGPSLVVTAVGLKDRKGILKAELYPFNDSDFLADDNVLVNARKTFRRVLIEMPQTGPVRICIRAPAAGVYALTLLQDRDRDGRFNRSRSEGDGLGFGSNPASLGPFKPSASVARVTVGAGPTPVTVRMMYRTGLLSVTPLRTN